MKELVTFTAHGAVRVITIDNPPVNGLGAAVRTALVDHIEAGIDDPAIEAFVILGARGMFSGGADIREFGKPPDPDAPGLPEVIQFVEDSPVPVVAAIDAALQAGEAAARRHELDHAQRAQEHPQRVVRDEGVRRHGAREASWP